MYVQNIERTHRPLKISPTNLNFMLNGNARQAFGRRETNEGVQKIIEPEIRLTNFDLQAKFLLPAAGVVYDDYDGLRKTTARW